jgi:hypothetical protein
VALFALSTAFAATTARGDDAGAGGAIVAPWPTSAGPVVSVEPLVLAGQRVRADGAVQASTADEALARWNVGGNSDPGYVSNRPGFHVAPRVMVDTTVLGGRLPARSTVKGALSRLAVLAQTRNHGYWPFRVCFESGLRDDASLRGVVALRFTIARSGHVSASRLTGPPFKDREVARCVATRVRALVYTPAPSRAVDVDLTVELNPGDAPLPLLARPAPLPSPPVALARPGSTKASLKNAQAALSARAAELTSCFAAALGRDPGLWGRIGFRIGVARDGNVSHVEQNESRFPDRDLVACAVSVIKTTPLCGAETASIELEGGVRFGEPPEAVAPVSMPPSNSPVAEKGEARLPLGN